MWDPFWDSVVAMYLTQVRKRRTKDYFGAEHKVNNTTIVTTLVIIMTNAVVATIVWKRPNKLRHTQQREPWAVEGVRSF